MCVESGPGVFLLSHLFFFSTHPILCDRFSADYWARIGLAMGAAASAGANDAAYTKKQLEVRRKWRRVSVRASRRNRGAADAGGGT